MVFKGLSPEQTRALELELIPARARLQLTRQLRAAAACEEDSNAQTARQNQIVNIARQVVGLAPYVLRSDDWGDYDLAEHAWHRGELEVAMLRPTTPQLIEVLGDLIDADWLDHREVNEVLADSACGATFRRPERNLVVDVTPTADIPPPDEAEIPNIRALIDRMQRALVAEDFPLVLHSSASVFETLAKDVVATPGVQDQPLGGFFSRYEKDSRLAKPLLDYILGVYQRRGKEPIAGHGHIAEPTITREEATFLCEITPAIVRIERELHRVEAEGVKSATIAKKK